MHSREPQVSGRTRRAGKIAEGVKSARGVSVANRSGLLLAKLAVMAVS